MAQSLTRAGNLREAGHRDTVVNDQPVLFNRSHRIAEVTD
jgi:hypothetical protein